MIRYRLFGRRARRAFIIAGSGLVLLAAGMAALVADAVRDARPDVSGPVLPGWSEMAGQAAAIEIITPDTLFRMERTPEGWTMPSRGNYPVRAEHLAELDAGLSSLSYAAALTNDAGRFDRLGVDDPAAGGSGTSLVITDADGNRLASLIVGHTRGDDRLYIRTGRQERAFAVQGSLPDIADPGRWLGLDFFNVEPSRIARAYIVPESGPAYILERESPATRNFDLASPRTWQLITAGAANGVASAGARVRFRDVGEASGDAGAPVALHRASTFDGLVYEYRFYREEGAIRARINIDASDHDVMDEASGLRRNAQGFWFAVSEDAYERMTRPLEQAATRSVTPVTE
ncbi:hypothetical protein X907_0171 [Glycocaulis alkaliphilus]|uniref:DUF4340 domain-containing protein n=1 Tax=Glycocaulis alkaliphilus TaxID=1434191 RepID=A0A3T0E5R9_9PROT|nr:DUF4340 domain-containing protein [Glycocaulis alkaliphilus]AZU02721.1 hypothetical protein X907_0171 [Glycocaulis alkaliphilus]GGB79520.1 hypothetical protein GCM10007417_19260 [Glycocaulis alkaliphilus]